LSEDGREKGREGWLVVGCLIMRSGKVKDFVSRGRVGFPEDSREERVWLAVGREM